MRVCVKLFAAARQQAGQEVVEVELPESATVADLRAQLAHQFPALQPGIAQLLIAVNHQYATEDAPLAGKAEVAAFPPVSGG